MRQTPAVGLLVMISPGVIFPPENLPHINSLVRAMLSAVCLLAFLGIRYPLKMLPVLFFELLWKSVWLLAFGFRLWSARRLDQNNSETLRDCLFGVIVVLLVTPWDYIFKHYVKAYDDSWRRMKRAISDMKSHFALSRALNAHIARIASRLCSLVLNLQPVISRHTTADYFPVSGLYSSTWNSSTRNLFV